MDRNMGIRENVNNGKVSAGTWKKLLKYCKKYHIVIALAVLFSAAGSALTIAGPDKLSEITDTISEGLVPDEEKLEEISVAVGDNTSANMELIVAELTENMASVIPEDITINNSTITYEEQIVTMQALSEAATETGEGWLYRMYYRR